MKQPRKNAYKRQRPPPGTLFWIEPFVVLYRNPDDIEFYDNETSAPLVTLEGRATDRFGVELTQVLTEFGPMWMEDVFLPPPPKKKKKAVTKQ